MVSDAFGLQRGLERLGGDVAVAPHKMSITLPVATKADGSPITGPVVPTNPQCSRGR